MPIIHIDVVIGIEIYRATAPDEVRRAMWLMMVARLTCDAQVISTANRHLIAELASWAFTERLFGPSKKQADEH
jgi:hypothetical protein